MVKLQKETEEKMKAKRKYAIPRRYEDVGEYLQQARKRAGYSQRQVADTLGYSSAQFISNFERGIAVPPLKKLKVLVKMYKLPVPELMDKILDAERRLMEAALDPRKGHRA
jgi:transcriptional regulator with XRE-family HTH domain